MRCRILSRLVLLGAGVVVGHAWAGEKFPKKSGPKPQIEVSDREGPQPIEMGGLEKKVVEERIRVRAGAFWECGKSIHGKPQRVHARFVIDRFGFVSNAKVMTSIDANVQKCVVGVLNTMKFPKPEGGGIVEVDYPVEISAQPNVIKADIAATLPSTSNGKESREFTTKSGCKLFVGRPWEFVEEVGDDSLPPPNVSASDSFTLYAAFGNNPNSLTIQGGFNTDCSREKKDSSGGWNKADEFLKDNTVSLNEKSEKDGYHAERVLKTGEVIINEFQFGKEANCCFRSFATYRLPPGTTKPFSVEYTPGTLDRIRAIVAEFRIVAPDRKTSASKK